MSYIVNIWMYREYQSVKHLRRPRNASKKSQPEPIEMEVKQSHKYSMISKLGLPDAI